MCPSLQRAIIAVDGRCSTTWHSLLRSVGISIFASVFAVAAALLAYSSFRHLGFYNCGGSTTQGKNVLHALALVVYGGLAEVALIVSVRKRSRLLAAVLFLGAIGLAVAIGLVGRDNATYLQLPARHSATPFGGCGPNHAGYLYPLWALSLVIFLVQGIAHLLTETPAPSER
jgi:hypothetical protein